MLRCLCAAQLFISYFCIYKRLIHEAPATQGKQLFGDSSILVFFSSGFSSIISPLFLLLRGVGGEGACRIMKSFLFPGRQLEKKLDVAGVGRMDDGLLKCWSSNMGVLHLSSPHLDQALCTRGKMPSLEPVPPSCHTPGEAATDTHKCPHVQRC